MTVTTSSLCLSLSWTNLAADATQTISLIAESVKLTSALGCELWVSHAGRLTSAGIVNSIVKRRPDGGSGGRSPQNSSLSRALPLSGQPPVAANGLIGYACLRRGAGDGIGRHRVLCVIRLLVADARGPAR